MDMLKSFAQLRKSRISEVGGKGYSLALLINNGFNVPKGFVIASEAFSKFLRHNDPMEKIEELASGVNEESFKEKSKEIKDLILGGKIPQDIVSETRDCLDSLNPQYVSIRSSAISEDSLRSSFAGLFDTFLNVEAELSMVLESVKKCWASLFNERAIVYRIRKKMPHLEGMAVIVQEMIPAEISGVTFTVHPSDQKSLLVEASYGLGDMIVSGKVEPDDYIVDRERLEILDKDIGNKDKMTACEKGTIEIIKVKDEDQRKQAIADERIKEIADTCLKVEKIFNYPQDIEWSIYNNTLWILQSRSITGVTR